MTNYLMIKSIPPCSICFAVLVLLFSSCRRELNVVEESKQIVPADFRYNTSVPVRFKITGPSYAANAVAGVFSRHPERGGRLIGKVRLNSASRYNGFLELPSSLPSVYVQFQSLDVLSRIVPVNNRLVDFNVLDKSMSRRNTGGRIINAPSVSSNGIKYIYSSGFNQNGTPANLIKGGKISAGLMGSFYSSLPEGKSILKNRPSFVKGKKDVVLKGMSEVWLKFLSDGSGYRSTLGYYTYNPARPPKSINDIKKIHILVPNMSGDKSGGELQVGDKVRLGAFPYNTAIGFVLFQNGWNSSGVNVNVPKLFSTPALNAKNDKSCKSQSVLLHDPIEKVMLIGFEDKECNGLSDKDFNDIAFVIESKPWQALSDEGVAKLNVRKDDDGDGIPNENDDYPQDKEEAFNNYIPFKNRFSSLAFDDLWPAKGDEFDFNDLVIDINSNYITNALNQVTEIEFRLLVRNIGASYKNGFGIQLPFDAHLVESVEGTNISEGIVNIRTNGVEFGQTKAVVIAFDNAFQNEGKELKIEVELRRPVDYSLIIQSGINPFIFVDGERSREVHLMDKEPTDLINKNYFQMMVDRSVPEEGKYYRAVGGRPWAINISYDYSLPKRNVAINRAYLKFDTWVNSGGMKARDWFEDRSGYRNKTQLQ